jgi:hypothetical protein
MFQLCYRISKNLSNMQKNVRFPLKKNSDDVTARKGKNEKCLKIFLFSIIPNFTHIGLALA